ncbi:MAG: sugar phosphate isomerase/epimerase [Clostridiales bacterium]|jgi:sugar phosphate isomerase/epimerase|nr:sugar phosphate isomerase/epimerase [Clostridiales bacterium]
MRYGNAAWGFRETPLEKQLELTREMNLPLLELDVANAEGGVPLDADEARLAFTRGLYERYGIALDCACAGNDFTIGDPVAEAERVKRVIDICVGLRARYLRIFAGFSPVGEVVGARWDAMIAALRAVGEYARGKVTLVVETHGGVTAYDDGVTHFHSVTTTEETLARMLAEIPENIMFLYDPANLWAAGHSDPSALLGVLGERVAAAHFKDFVPLPSGRLLPAACGEGQMDWKPILHALRGRDLPVLFEYENTADVAEGSRRCRDFIFAAERAAITAT